MAQGNTVALEAALRDHQAATQSSSTPVVSPPAPRPTAGPPQPLDETSSIQKRLEALAAGIEAARRGWEAGDAAAVHRWAAQAESDIPLIRKQLEGAQTPAPTAQAPAPIAPTPSPAMAPAPEEDLASPTTGAMPAPDPTILLPKVRHPVSLVIAGMGDGDRSVELAEALGVDGVTARLSAISRYPRVVLRGEDRVRMEQTAKRVRSSLGILAEVVDRDTLLAVGPAVAILQATSCDPLRLEVVGRPMWDIELSAQGPEEPRMVEPSIELVVVGEIVVQQFRSLTQGGRLKHVREARVQGSGENRLAVVDLHGPQGIYRMVEGQTDLSGFPGHTPSSARRSFKDFGAYLAAQGLTVLPQRVCQPGLHRPTGGVVAGQVTTGQATGWATWEEHSRSCRCLYGISGPQETADDPE